MNDRDRVEEIKAQTDRAVRDALDEYPNALYHDIGYAKEGGELTGEPAIVVTVSGKVDEDDLDPEDILPKEIEGYRVDVIEQQAVPNVPGDHRRERIRPLVGGTRFTSEDGPESCSAGIMTVQRGSDPLSALSNHHCVAEEDTAEPSPVGTTTWQPGSFDDDSEFGTVLDTLPRRPDVGDDLLHDAALIELDDPDDARSSTFVAGEFGAPEDAVLGEIYVTNGVNTGYRGARCTLVPETGLHNRFELSDREDWGGNSGSVWGRYDDGVFHPVALHHSSSTVTDPTEAIATSWAALEDEWGTLSIPDDPGQPSPFDSTDDPVHEVCCYDAEVDGETVTLSLFAANTAGGAETKATVEVRCESWDESEPDDGEVIDSFEVDNDSFEISYHEIDVPRVQSFRRMVFDAQWDGDNNDMGDIHVDEAPSGSYLGFSDVELDDDDDHPGGTISVDWVVKNGGESSGSTDVELLIDGTVEDSDTTASLDAGEDDSGTLEWDVGDGDEGTFSVEVETDDETVDLGDVEIGESVVVTLTNTEPDSDGVRIYRTDDPDDVFADGYVEVADVEPTVTEYHDRDLPEGAGELRYAVVAYSRTGGDEIESPPGLSSGVQVGDLSGVPGSVVDHLDVWYPMDEGSGSVLSDALDEYELDATWSPGTWESDGYYGGAAIDFDGDDDTFEGDEDETPGSGFAACAWLTPTEYAGNNGAFGAGDMTDIGNAGTGPMVSASSGPEITLWRNDDGDSGDTLSVSVSSDTRYFVGFNVTSDSGELFVWDEDSQIGSDSDTGMSHDVLSSDLRPIGGVFDGDYFEGTVEAVGYNYTQELTESEFEEIRDETS